jgi:hypothetical protein
MLLVARLKLKALKVFALLPSYGGIVTCHLLLDLSGRYPNQRGVLVSFCSRVQLQALILNCQYDRTVF